MEFISIPLDKIVFQPEEKMLRPVPKITDKDWDTVVDLANDMELNGQIHPPTVRRDGDFYVVEDGARRVTAAKHGFAELGHKRFADGMVCSVTTTEEKKSLARSIAANYHSKKTMKTQEISALRRLILDGSVGTVDELSALTGLSSARILDLFKITTLPQEIQTAVDSKEISIANALSMHKLPATSWDNCEVVEKAKSDKAEVFASYVADRLNEMKPAKAGSKAPKVFVAGMIFMKPSEIEELKVKAEETLSADPSDYNRGVYDALLKVMGTDPESIAKREAAFNAEQAKKAEEAAKRAKERDQKKLEAALNLVKSAGISLDGSDFGANEAPDFN